MNNKQRILLAIYLPITLLILIFDNLYPKADVVQYLKYAIMISLFLSVIGMRKKFYEQKLMVLSFFFLVIADFFLVFFTTLENPKINLSPLGVTGFLLAYFCLIAAYQKNFKVGKAEIITAIPIAIIFMYAIISLQPYIKGLMLIGTLIFGMVLSYMTWTAICTVFRRHFNPKTAWLIALSGILMFICDMGVAFSLFHPYFSESYIPWIKNIIWAAYIPGWTLLAVITSEKNLRVQLEEQMVETC